MLPLTVNPYSSLTLVHDAMGWAYAAEKNKQWQATTCGGDDCKDSAVHPGAKEICGDGVDQDCSGADLACSCPDADGDTYADKRCGGTDCDDKAREIHPKAEEIPGDGVDQDCDGADDDERRTSGPAHGCQMTGPAGRGAGPALLLLLWLLAWRCRGARCCPLTRTASTTTFLENCRRMIRLRWCTMETRKKQKLSPKKRNLVKRTKVRSGIPYECDDRFGECGHPEQSGGGCGCGGGGTIII
jgi:hypothetical protein